MKREISKILPTAIAFLFFTGPVELKAQAPQNEIRVAAIGCICDIGNSGHIDIIATGDAGPFTFQWSGPEGYASTEQSPDDITVPGEYEVTVTNAYGCSVVLPRPGEEVISIGMCPFPDIIATPQPSCPNQSVGALSLSVEYGEAPYTFAWAHDAEAAGPEVAQLPAGVYAVTVTDARGCSASGEYEVTDSEPISLEVALTHDCGMQHQGAVVVSAAGGDGAYQYHWNNNWEDSQLTGLGAGVYKVTVTDSRGCRAMDGYTIENRELPAVSAQVDPARCLTALDGAIVLEIATDNGVNYAVTWSNNATGTELSGLAAGLYTATVTDDNGCQTVATYATTPTTPQDAMPYIRHVKIYAPQINAPDILIYDGQWVTAASGCMFFTGGSLPISQTLLDAMTAGEQDLRMELEVSEMLNYFSVSNNSMPIYYSAGNFGTNLNILISENIVQQMLVDGSLQETFVFAGTDFDGNPLLDLRAMSLNLTECVTVPQLQPNCEWQPPLSGMTGVDDVHVLTRPCMDVAIDILANPSGGFNLKAAVSGDPQQYTYLWTKASSGEVLGSTNQLTGVGPGRYCLKVSGPGGCIVELCENVCAPLQEDLQLAIDPPCPGQPNGSVCLSSASMLPLVVTWQLNGSTDVCLSGLYEGFEYCATVSELSCGQEITYCTDHLDAISAVAVSLVQATPSCPGMSNGRLQVSASGGRPPYAYAWSNGNHSSIATGLSAQSSLTVTVTDACGQTTVQSYTVPSYPALALTGADENPACGSSANGSVRVYFQGGVAPLVFQWSGPQGFSDTGANPFIQHLSPGDYNVTITDACGQSVTGGPYTVEMTTYFGSFWVSDAAITQVCGSASDGAIDLTVTNNNEFGTLSYLWSTGATTEDIAMLGPGLYTVTISHSGGCSTVQHYQVFRAQILDLHESVSSSYCKLNDGAIAIAPEGVYLGNLTYSWSNGSHASQLTHLIPGDYTVTITYGFDDACTQVETFTIEEETTDLDAVVTNIEGASEIFDPQFPVGSQDGSVHISVSGGYPPYAFAWSNGATTQNLDDVGSGTYWLTVTDSRGCEEILSATVPACNFFAPTINLAFGGLIPLSAPGGGAINLTINQGTPPFQYLWSGPSDFSSEMLQISGLTENGIYALTITDNCGNTTTKEIYLDHCEHATGLEVNTLDQCQGDIFENSRMVLAEIRAEDPNVSLNNTNVKVEWTKDGSQIVESGFAAVYGSSNLGYFIDEPLRSHDMGENEGGTFCVSVTDFWGCHYEECRSFGSPFAVGPFLESINLQDSYYNQSLIISSGLSETYEAIVGSWKCVTCDAPFLGIEQCTRDLEHGLFSYSPADETNPCNGGGVITDISGNEYIVISTNVNISTLFQQNDKCGCLFLPGMVLSIPAELQDLPVYVEFACDPDQPPPPPPSGYCDNCETNCVVEAVAEDPCEFQLICEDDNEIILTITNSTIECYSIENDGSCFLVEACAGLPCVPDMIEEVSSNDCIGEDVFICPPCLLSGETTDAYAGARSRDASNKKSVHHKMPSQAPEAFDVQVFPNPYTTEITIIVNPLPAKTTTQIIITDLLGKQVFLHTWYNEAQGRKNYKLLPPGLSPGPYLITVKNDKGNQFSELLLHVGN